MKNIQDILKSIAESRFEDCADHFKDFNHFRDCLEKTYCLIANRTAQKFVEKLDGVFYDRAQFQAECSTLCRIEFSYIYSGEFKDMFPRFKIGGVKKSVKYSLLLSALVDEGVVKANENFSYYKDNEFPKSYTLDFRFVASRIDEWFELNRDKDLEIYDALYAYYPNKLLNAKIAEAKRLYDSLQDGADGLDVRLPDEWEKSISPFGWCVWNDKLTIDGVLSGLNKFAARKVTGYRYGRYYDWFTAMPSAFRMHVREGGSPYFELTDCRAGMFWMAAILGARQGRISKDEARRMLDCCFAGSFYEMISRREKTRAVKTTFMKVMNMHGGQLGFLERSDDVAQTIVENISAEFPEWWSFMDGRRKEFKGEIGLKNHEDLTEIEREVMDELADAVKKTGVMHVRRVHDALWATEDCEDVEDMLYGIAVKMIQAAHDRSKQIYETQEEETDGRAEEVLREARTRRDDNLAQGQDEHAAGAHASQRDKACREDLKGNKMNYMKHLQRSPEAQAHELMVNCLDAREWDQDKRRYCMLYCNVFDEIDEYIDAVEREYAKLKKAYLEGKAI